MRLAPWGAAAAVGRRRCCCSILLLLIQLKFLLLLISCAEFSLTNGELASGQPSRSAAHHETTAVAANNERRLAAAAAQRATLPPTAGGVVEMTNDALGAASFKRQVIQSDGHKDEISTSAARHRKHSRRHHVQAQAAQRRRRRRQRRQWPARTSSETRQASASERGPLGSVSRWPVNLANNDDDDKELNAPLDSPNGGQKRLINLIRLRRHQQTGPTNSTISASARMRSSKEEAEERVYVKRLEMLRQKYMTNRAISDRAYYVLLVIYALFIIFGTISNFLICLTVVLKPKILSPRNIFIVNLAGSDLLLCVFTMPFSFIELSMKMWQMGLITCKLVAGLQATSIFVSTISITAIALDRYKVIVYPTHQETASGARGAALLLASVWFGALVLSLPLFGYRTVEQIGNIIHNRPASETTHLSNTSNFSSSTSTSLENNNNNNSTSNGNGPSGFLNQLLNPTLAAAAAPTSVEPIEFCIEKWPFNHGRGFYSVVSMIFQYVLPITIVSIVYTKISRKLQKRLIRRQQLTQLQCHQKRQLHLIRRTHTMLVSVSLVFGLSWLPLNLLNVISDFSPKLLQLVDDQSFRIIFAICHLIGCSSACSNPILYGFLNENFRKEFRQVYDQHARLLTRFVRRRLLCCCWKLEEDNNKQNSYLTKQREIQLNDEIQNRNSSFKLEPGGNNRVASRDDEEEQVLNGQRRNKINSSTSSASSLGSSSCETSDTGNSSMSNSLDDQSISSSSSSSKSLEDLAAPLRQRLAPARNLTNAPAASLASLQLTANAIEGRPKSTRSLSMALNNSIGDSHLRNSDLLSVPPNGKAQSVNCVQEKKDNGNEAQEERKFSFQTITSGRQTMGKTMRLCFCLSDSSSSEILAATNNQSKRRLSLRMDQLDNCHVANAKRSERKRRRRRHRRRARQLRARHQQLQLECACQCHRQQLERLPFSGGGGGNKQADNQLSSASVGELAAAKIEGDRQKEVAAAAAAATIGRRVWLRFLGGLSSSHEDENEAPPPPPGKGVAPDDDCDFGAKDTGEARKEIRATHKADDEACGGEATLAKTADGTTYEIESSGAYIHKPKEEATQVAPLQSAETGPPIRRHHCNNCKHSRKLATNGDDRSQRRARKRKRRDQPTSGDERLVSEMSKSSATPTCKRQRWRLRHLTNWLGFSRSSWRGGGGGQHLATSGCGEVATRPSGGTTIIQGKVNGVGAGSLSAGAKRSSVSMNGDRLTKMSNSSSKQTSNEWQASRKGSIRGQASQGLVASLSSTLRGRNETQIEMLAASGGQLTLVGACNKALQTSNKTATMTTTSCVEGKQVGKVYLSIETGGHQGDSMLSLSREKSTSVVLLDGEGDCELEQGGDEALAFNQAARPASSCSAKRSRDYAQATGHGSNLDGASANAQANGGGPTRCDDVAQINNDANNLPPPPGAAGESLASGSAGTMGERGCWRQQRSGPEVPLAASQSEVCVRQANSHEGLRALVQIELSAGQVQKQSPPACDELPPSIQPNQASGCDLQSSSSSSSSSYVLSMAHTSRTSTTNSSSCLCSFSASCSCHWTQTSTHAETRLGSPLPVASNIPNQQQQQQAATFGTNKFGTNQKRLAEASGGGGGVSSAPTTSEPQLAMAAAACDRQTFASGQHEEEEAAPQVQMQAQVQAQTPPPLHLARYQRHQSVRANQRQVPPGARYTRTLSATAGSVAGQAQRAAAAQAASQAAIARQTAAAVAARIHAGGHCASSRLQSSAANLTNTDRSTITNTGGGGAVGTATTASSCSLLFTNTTTSRSSFSELLSSSCATAGQHDGQHFTTNCASASSTEEEEQEEELDEQQRQPRRQVSGTDEETTMAAVLEPDQADHSGSQTTSNWQHSENATSSCALVSPRKVGQPLA